MGTNQEKKRRTWRGSQKWQSERLISWKTEKIGMDSGWQQEKLLEGMEDENRESAGHLGPTAVVQSRRRRARGLALL